MTDINKQLRSKDPVERYKAVESEHFGPEHVEHMLKDKEMLVRVAVMASPHYATHIVNEKMGKSEEGTMKEKIKGGLADGKSLKDIAEKHNIELTHIEEQFKMGQKVELEHTDDQSKADEISKDHLWEDPNYYTKLKDMEAKKCESMVVETTADGHITRTPGKEPLKKDPKQSSVSKSLKEMWDLLKSKISANQAFVSMEEPEEQPDYEADEADEMSDAQPQDQQPAELEQSQLSPDEEQQLQQAATEQAPDDGFPETMEELEQKMRDEGYSDSEIAYVIHNHIPPMATLDDHKSSNEVAGGEQERAIAQREADLKHEHASKLNEIEQKKKEAELNALDPDADKEHAKVLKMLEYEKAQKQMDAEDHEGEKEHKRRMRDLEYKRAKDELELELEFKRKELELKLKQKEEAFKAKKDSTGEDK
jgi:hypothetical protein